MIELRRLGHAIFCCLVASLGFGQTSTPTAEELHKELVALIRANSYRVEFRDGQLSGPGADHLLQAARSSQFLVLAEEHYVREIPQITTALLRQLQPAGYNYLAIESATVQARMASAPPLRGNRSALFDFTRAYPFSLTFFSDQEVEMIAEAGRISRGKGDAVWGIDQEFGATHVLERLLSHAPTAEARQSTQDLLERVRQYENAATRADLNDDNHFMAAIARPEDFTRLRTLYAPAKQGEVQAMIEALTESSTIFSHYRENRGYLNSSTREQYMKDVFMAEYRRAQKLDGRAPRVIVKAGHWHTLRGMNRASVFTLGNFLSEFAYANGLKSLHVSMHIHGPEGYWREIRKSEAMKPFAEAAPPDQFTLVDLRPMRPFVARRAVRAAFPRETVSQFFEADALLILGGAQPATTSELVKG